MEGLLFFFFFLSDGFRFILIPDGNLSHEFPVLDGNPSSNMNSAIQSNRRYCPRGLSPLGSGPRRDLVSLAGPY
jgi:hypothetical protein